MLYQASFMSLYLQTIMDHMAINDNCKNKKTKRNIFKMIYAILKRHFFILIEQNIDKAKEIIDIIIQTQKVVLLIYLWS